VTGGQKNVTGVIQFWEKLLDTKNAAFKRTPVKAVHPELCHSRRAKCKFLRSPTLRNPDFTLAFAG